MNELASQHELRQSHKILRLYAALLLTTFEGHLKLDQKIIEDRAQKVTSTTTLHLAEVLDGIERIVLTAAIIPVLLAKENLNGELQSILAPGGVGSSVQADNAVFEEFIIELLMEHDPERLNLQARGLCDVLRRVADMTALPAEVIIKVVNPVYLRAFVRQMEATESAFISAENRVTEPLMRPALRAVAK